MRPIRLVRSTQAFSDNLRKVVSVHSDTLLQSTSRQNASRDLSVQPFFGRFAEVGAEYLPFNRSSD